MEDLEANNIFSYLYVTDYLTSTTCDFGVKMKQILLNEGFHRNITYEILFQDNTQIENWLYSCIIGLDQPIPSGVYVNPDELGDLRRTNRMNAFPKNKVNVELVAAQASSSSVYVIGKVIENKLHLWIPIHARYHHAIVGGGMVRNEISPPKLYIRCIDDRLSMCKDVPVPDGSLFCSNDKENCDWLQMPYNLLTKSIVWEVPVGNLDHYYIAAVGTTMVIIVGSLYILKIIHEYKTKDFKKLR
ncbi:Phosphatidylinositol-glycan biosynthesis class X protein [Eumeta japonica]|uniref:Phosphatidylinositol-glycan biosynthesis class X protein n=1 Tax=Eumeta variegata TaxID=151549 RepID=A0A4C1VEI4_EUMVA|nr:Phosphatidylinositol-glycan biosynthesis class X protein [Eumeta japonica]